jgi:hypothetical protein
MEENKKKGLSSIDFVPELKYAYYDSWELRRMREEPDGSDLPPFYVMYTTGQRSCIRTGMDGKLNLYEYCSDDESEDSEAS